MKKKLFAALAAALMLGSTMAAPVSAADHFFPMCMEVLQAMGRCGMGLDIDNTPFDAVERDRGRKDAATPAHQYTTKSVKCQVQE